MVLILHLSCVFFFNFSARGVGFLELSIRFMVSYRFTVCQKHLIISRMTKREFEEKKLKINNVDCYTDVVAHVAI
ncbi:hypothetical protein DERF_007471 [Dermatophagoides farinae]|uniref:Secreted protein n=1 Tax=Dermatophagoides farinae TaxID=6954 RepID=A0A922I162_DERFA|nr:hypothetical protein DERF_007471 [Dermatophagoides farinae]